MKKIIFIICTERGSLENKSVLLVKSIREFGGAYKNCNIVSFSPRSGYEISDNTQRIFDELNVKHLNLPLNVDYKDYPLANKPLVCAYVEENFRSDCYVFFDSDKILLSEPKEFAFDDNYDIALRPVDIKNIGSFGEQDVNHDYWKKLYAVTGVKSLKFVQATVDQSIILEYWNSGLIAVKSGKNVFIKWKENFEKIMESGLKPSQGEFFLEQSAFAATVSALKLSVFEFPNAYNYPIHMQDAIPAKNKINMLDDLVTVHYHRVIENGSFAHLMSKMQAGEEIGRFIKKNILLGPPLLA